MLPEEAAEAVGAVAAAEATAAVRHFGGGGHGGGGHFGGGAAVGGASLAARAAAGRGSPAADGTFGRAGPRYPDRQGDRLSAAIVRLPSAIPQEILQAATPASDPGRSNAVHHALAVRARSRVRCITEPRCTIPATVRSSRRPLPRPVWHDHHRQGGWWRHGNGGYGWVGPLFWPFAYYDIYDYAFWGYDPSFWGYGYGDIYAGIFAPYGYDDLTGYMPSGGGGYSGGAASTSRVGKRPAE